MPSAPEGIVIPKVSDPDHVKAVHATMGAFATMHKVPMPQLAIIVTENASGVLHMRETMSAVPGIAAAFWGSEDLSGDLGSISTVDDQGELLDVFRVARSLFLLEARHAGLPAVDAPFLAIKDVANSEIHPEEIQLEPTHAVVPDTCQVGLAAALVTARTVRRLLKKRKGHQPEPTQV